MSEKGSDLKMPETVRIGQLLQRVVPISEHDIHEILTEQSNTRRRFGSIALSWGLCEPEHIWSAWLSQLEYGPQHVNLRDMGIDGQATAHMSRELALRFRAVPVRVLGEQIVIAIDETYLEQAREELGKLLAREIKFVTADAIEIDRAIKKYYTHRA